jgi:hypothetical protein
MCHHLSIRLGGEQFKIWVNEKDFGESLIFLTFFLYDFLRFCDIFYVRADKILETFYV